MAMKKIGLASGMNHLPALRIKSYLIGAGAGAAGGKEISVVEEQTEVRSDAPTDRIALGDRKIAAYLALRRLDASGCEAAILPDVRIQPYLTELQKEVRIPLIPLFGELAQDLRAKGIRKAALLGSALASSYFRTLVGGEVELIEATPVEMEAFEALQDPQSGLRRFGLTEGFKASLVSIGQELQGRGAECLIPNCTQIARFAEELQQAGLPVWNALKHAAEHAAGEKHERLPKPYKIGIIGGLGPAATVDLCDKIVKATPAKTDQEHIKVAVEQNPQTPDRTACLLDGGEDPTLALYGCALRLEEDGCDAIVVPCNTAHAFIPCLERHLHVPFINMQQTALDEIKAKLGGLARIGLLATSGTIRTGIYGEKAKAMNMPMFVPDAQHQERVMAAIYGPEGAKAGFTDGICREDLLSGAEYLVREFDCNCLILGCTELPLILDESDAFEIAGKSVIVIDPTAALARKVAAEAEKAYEERGTR